MDARFLRRFLVHLAGRGHSPTSQGKYLRAVKTWLRWLDAEGGYGVESAFCDRFRAPERPDDPPKPLEPAECEALFRACSKSWMGVRMRAMLAILLDTGLRASELCGLLEWKRIAAAQGCYARRKGRAVSRRPALFMVSCEHRRLAVNTLRYVLHALLTPRPLSCDPARRMTPR